MIRRPPRSARTDTLFPDTTLFRSHGLPHRRRVGHLAPHDPAHRILLPVARSARELGAIRATDSAISTYAIPYQNPQKTATTVDPLAWVCYENVARRRGEHDAPEDRKSTRLNSSHSCARRMPSSA